MSSAIIRFECQLPVPTFGTPDYNAITTFYQQMATLTVCYYYQVNEAPSGNPQLTAFYGYLTSAQTATALGYLNTLNAALSTGPVTCVAWNGTSEP